MKLVLSSLIAFVLVAAAPAFAAAPESVTLKGGAQGDVTFNHKAHQKQGCKTCHGEGAPKKIELNKDSAHKLCIECHKEKAAGPTKCTECHKKA